MQLFLSILFLSITYIGTLPPSLCPTPQKMVVGMALEIILQPLKSFCQSRTNSENSKNPEITSNVKFIIEGIYETYFKHKCIT